MPGALGKLRVPAVGPRDSSPTFFLHTALALHKSGAGLPCAQTAQPRQGCCCISPGAPFTLGSLWMVSLGLVPPGSSGLWTYPKFNDV